MDAVRDWARLPVHLLDAVVGRLELLSDYFQFSAVCMPWYQVANDNQIQRAKMMLTTYRPPFLLTSTDTEDTWNVYNVVDNKVLGLQLNLPNKSFCGYSRGWLMTVEEDLAVTLMNPFFRVKGRTKKEENSIIRLPQLISPPTEHARNKWSKEHCRYVYRATLSADPILDPHNCIALVSYENRCRVAFIRVGKDTEWTYFHEHLYPIHDLVYFEDKFLAVSDSSKLYWLDLTAPSQTKVFCVERELEDDSDDYVQKYLVDLNGKQLLLVHRYLLHEVPTFRRSTRKFQVFYFDCYIHEWVVKKDLDGVAIFLGNNNAISVLASNFPGCRANCIYFNHDHDRIKATFENFGPEDYGVYNLLDNSISQPYTTDAESLLKTTKLCPIWALPTFQL